MDLFIKRRASCDSSTSPLKQYKNNSSNLLYSTTNDLNVSNSIKEERIDPNVTKSDNCNVDSTTYASMFPCDSKKVKNENRESNKNRSLETVSFKWRIITSENLKLRYAEIFNRPASKYILTRLEKEVEYYSGDLLKVRVFGKWHAIPRKQVAFGDDGLSYKFSGNCVPSKPWDASPIIFELKKCVESVVGCSFNFVLVNRYKDGSDHMGEHRDDEKELDPEAPIASLSFGTAREFFFRHKDARGKDAKLNVEKIKIDLNPGSLLLMEYPTNNFWYHSLPARKKVFGVRVNLTFRKMIR